MQPPVWRRSQRARSRLLRAGVVLRRQRAARSSSQPFWHSHRRWVQSMAQAHSQASPLVAHSRPSLPVAHARWRCPRVPLLSGSSARSGLAQRLQAARQERLPAASRPQPAPQPREPRSSLWVAQWVVRHQRNLPRVRERRTPGCLPAFSSVVRVIPCSIPLSCREGFEYALVPWTVADAPHHQIVFRRRARPVRPPIPLWHDPTG